MSNEYHILPYLPVNKEKRRYFFELVNDKYQEVTGELKKYFDDIYNKEIEIMCLGENENKNDKLSKITKKVVKVGKVAITVCNSNYGNL